MDIVCFSHLRWDFVYQRPQHLLSRLACGFRVFYIEEPYYQHDENTYSSTVTDGNVVVIKIFLEADERSENIIYSHQKILDQVFKELDIEEDVFWYYTPMALLYSSHRHPNLIIYDCMDELSAFKFAPFIVKEMEAELFKKADIVFAGGYSIYEAKKDKHPEVYLFPSSIDKWHFERARTHDADPTDQQHIPHPRFGFYGVLDERLDLQLIDQIAMRKPDWQFIFIGPVVKIDEQSLPRHSNIHYLGAKQYHSLPDYLTGWDVAMLCFAINESTKFISPTQTPEYLSAGKKVISTPVKDVVREYGENFLVYIADGPEDFIRAGESALAEEDSSVWLAKVDNYLSDKSWDKTVKEMQLIIHEFLMKKTLPTQTPQEIYV